MHVSRYVLYSMRAISNSLHSLSSHSLPPLNTAHAQHMKYKHPNHSNHGQCMYLIQTQMQVLGRSTGTYC